MATYIAGPHYTTLQGDEIRVLILSPGKSQDLLVGSFKTVSMSDRPRYGAISYTWGEPVFDQPIELQQGQGWITKSLSGALRRLRDPVSQVALWADALCINQADIKERNSQVKMMGRIYSSAERVLVWLGDACAADACRMWMLHTLANLLQVVRDPESRNPNSLKEVLPGLALHEVVKAMRREITRSGAEPRCHCCGQIFSWQADKDQIVQGLHALHDFFTRPWFSRLWVVQEIGLAGRGQCEFFAGRHTVSLSTLTRALNERRRLQEDLTLPVEATIARGPLDRVDRLFRFIRRRTMAPHKGVPKLFEVLVETIDLRYSEPRDRIFAVLALADTEADETLQPCYTVDVEDLWRRATLSILATAPRDTIDCGWPDSHPSTILAWSTYRRSHASNLQSSSWVTDFSCLHGDAQRKWQYYEDINKVFQAGGDDIFDMMWNPQDPTTLQIRGVIDADIAAVLVDSAPCSQLDQEERFLTTAQFWHAIEADIIPWYLRCWRFACGSEKPSEKNCSVEDLAALLRRDGSDRESSKYSGPTFEQFRPVFVKAASANNYRDLWGLVDPRKAFGDLQPFISSHQVRYFVDEHSILAWTTEGELGWVPKGAVPGDEVCLFQGAPSPFIIRKRVDGSYTLLGDGYIEGIMNGEAWPDTQEDVHLISLT